MVIIIVIIIITIIIIIIIIIIFIILSIDRGGPRKSREKKRRAHRWAQKIKDHTVTYYQRRDAMNRKLIKKQQQNALTQAYIG